MKKLFSILLVMVLTLSMSFVMTSCGEDTDVTDDTTSQADTASVEEEVSEEQNVFPKALESFEALPIEDLANTGWTLSGGMVDGVEMEEADLQAVLDATGGVMQFVFLDEGKANLINGQQTFEGTYTLVNEDYIIDAVFTGYEYYGVLTPVGEEIVLIIVNKNDSETALYFTMIDEH